jgi:His-Xaa-Ser system radical SAM maturase HxsB
MTPPAARGPGAQARPAASAAPAYFRRTAGKVLLTNDWGHHVLLPEADFARWRDGTVAPGSALAVELQAKGFLRDRMDFASLARDHRARTGFLSRPGPGLHIAVVTLRCNHKCVYCHSAAVGPERPGVDMSPETVEKVMDLACRSAAPSFTLEFQGGEPLLNWPAVRRFCELAAERNARDGRGIRLALVSNLSLMDEEKLEFLLEHEVSLCTSLDGPEDLHERNRILLGGGAHARAAAWLRRLAARAEPRRAPRRRVFKPSALMTTTRFSLGRGREIVDEYLALGLEDIYLRPLSPIGHAKRAWTTIGYGAGEYVRFYRETLDYILERNRGGADFSERAAVVLLTKILRRADPGHVDLRSPCGAVVAQIAYNHDGRVFTCDEGRMVAQRGDALFQVGDAGASGWNDIVRSPACRVLAAASALEGQPACSRCAYKPYCGLCPVHNYEAQGSLWGAMPSSEYCAMRMGILDVLFERLERPADREIFERWILERREEDHGCTPVQAPR